jgi:hypothetical protein
MKSIVLALVLASSCVFAQAGGAAAAPAETKKMDKKTAKMECLKENPSLKGKELAHCVKGKMK